MPFHWQAWQSVLQRHRIDFPEDRFYALGGVPSRDILKMLCAEQGVDLDHLAVAREKEAAYLPFLAQVEPIQLVVAVAQEHFGKLPMAVASGGSKPIIEQVLQQLKIRHFFQAVVTNEDVVRQKPAPDIFLEAARRIGVPPRTAAPLKTPTWASKPSAPLGWMRSTSASCSNPRRARKGRLT